MFGIGAHHLYAGAIESVALLLCFRCALHGVFQLARDAAGCQLAAGEGLAGGSAPLGSGSTAPTSARRVTAVESLVSDRSSSSRSSVGSTGAGFWKIGS